MLITLAKLSLQSTPPSKVTRSPRKDVETLSKEEAADLPYPPDVFPGARDVESSVRPLSHQPFFQVYGDRYSEQEADI